jgi:hypothetical protein
MATTTRDRWHAAPESGPSLVCGPAHEGGPIGPFSPHGPAWWLVGVQQRTLNRVALLITMLDEMQLKTKVS